MRWRDSEGKVHAVEGTCFQPEGSWLLWTRCHLYDVENGREWKCDERVTCTGCNIARG
jgi:hypothetical protein